MSSPWRWAIIATGAPIIAPRAILALHIRREMRRCVEPIFYGGERPAGHPDMNSYHVFLDPPNPPRAWPVGSLAKTSVLESPPSKESSGVSP